MNDERLDRLYELLPAIYRIRDTEQGEPLKALLQVVAEQVNLVEDDIQQLYDNWFIETCEDWVVPYLGDLVGYEPAHEAGEPSTGKTQQAQQRNRILIPRREVANTIRYRRRKGSLALLELLAGDIADWPARAVEFYKLLSRTQALNHMYLDRGQTVDIRNGSTLALINTPFDSNAHSVDVHRMNPHDTQGFHNIPSVGVFVWRLRSYSVTETPAFCLESAGPNNFTFSVLGNDSPLYIRPVPESDPTYISEELNLPVPIRRRYFEENKAQIYGEGKSIQVWIGKGRGETMTREPVPLEHIVSADLTDWQYLPRNGKVAVDPMLGRIAFPVRQFPKNGVWVSYHYGFSMEFGGGEYNRDTSQPKEAVIYTVGKTGEFKTLEAALGKWEDASAAHAVIEITDSGVYVEPINIEFKPNQRTLQLRAANRKRPVICLLDWKRDRPDSLSVTGIAKNCFTLDGIIVTGRGMQIVGDIAEVTIRHATLVPGWTIDSDCEPQRSVEPSLEIFSPNVCVKIDHSIVGSIQIDPSIDVSLEANADTVSDVCTDKGTLQAAQQSIGLEARLDPIRICINDSVLDATDSNLEVLGAPGCPVAHACVNIVRSTVFGRIHVHAIELGENTIFMGRIFVARRQKGCLRFCYVTHESRTPRRYRCQPDLVEQSEEVPLNEEAKQKGEFIPKKINHAAITQEHLRVRPIFNSIRYGMPTYCQLAVCCADEIKRGADDEAEMGVFHNLFQPQRMANLSARLDEYLPARMNVGIIVSS